MKISEGLLNIPMGWNWELVLPFCKNLSQSLLPKGCETHSSPPPHGQRKSVEGESATALNSSGVLA